MNINFKIITDIELQNMKKSDIKNCKNIEELCLIKGYNEALDDLKKEVSNK